MDKIHKVLILWILAFLTKKHYPITDNAKRTRKHSSFSKILIAYNLYVLAHILKYHFCAVITN